MPSGDTVQRLEHCLVLLDDYLHPHFGGQGKGSFAFSELQARLRLAIRPEELDDEDTLLDWLKRNYAGGETELAGYVANVRDHLAKINANRAQDEQVRLKYFQWLALLYTEHVLDRFYTDLARFIDDLNALVDKRNQAQRNANRHIGAFTSDNLTRLAFWMATGSGKTLLMHINYHQILHYVQRDAPPTRRLPFKNILLITPNAALSTQHQQEFLKSGIVADLFDFQTASTDKHTVQILEITKLTNDTPGPLTVNVKSFGDENLIFVDEGHRGSTGDVWLDYRSQLAQRGFTFEYSATFGEALNKGTNQSARDTRTSYGKSIVFDYRYYYFHKDGYGKDYRIFNLPSNTLDDEQADVLLLANLLSVYEQTRVWLDHQDLMREYQIERPLLMYVGHTVQTGTRKSNLNEEDKRTLSDVERIAKILHRIAFDRDWAIRTIGTVLDGKSGLKDEGGVDVFTERFDCLRNLKAVDGSAKIYDGLLGDVLQARAPGRLQLVRLRNAPGEIAMRVGDSEKSFGVINIGDAESFLKKIEETAKRDDTKADQKGDKKEILVGDSDELSPSLFESINKPGSTVNMLLGAKKFTEGWSSWRVSAMGLLNVGKKEGSEVIQMFGRGVRLLGKDSSLKRSSAEGGGTDPSLPLLETLNIFSINGDYLKQFKEAMGREIPEAKEVVYRVPVQYSLFETEQPWLLEPRLVSGADFQSSPAIALMGERAGRFRVLVDMRPRVQVETGEDKLGKDKIAVHGRTTEISDVQLALLDWDEIYLGMLRWRRAQGYHNLLFSKDTLRQIVTEGATSSSYFSFYDIEERVSLDSYRKLRRLQANILIILQTYAAKFYNLKRQEWEAERLEYRKLTQDSPNMALPVLALNEAKRGYNVKVNIEEASPTVIEAMKKYVASSEPIYASDGDEIPNLAFDRHLYSPLFATGKPKDGGRTVVQVPGISSNPVALNDGEGRFIEGLRQWCRQHAETKLGTRKLYILRNQSRGKGVSFFTEGNFYPDFMLWIVEPHENNATPPKQLLVFVDPKGLVNLKPNDFSHPKIDLHNKLRNEIGPKLGNPDVSLDSFIVANSTYEYAPAQLGDPSKPYAKRDYVKNHVLFPDSAAETLMDMLLSY